MTTRSKAKLARHLAAIREIDERSDALIQNGPCAWSVDDPPEARIQFDETFARFAELKRERDRLVAEVVTPQGETESPPVDVDLSEHMARHLADVRRLARPIDAPEPPSFSDPDAVAPMGILNTSAADVAFVEPTAEQIGLTVPRTVRELAAAILMAQEPSFAGSPTREAWKTCAEGAGGYAALKTKCRAEFGKFTPATLSRLCAKVADARGLDSDDVANRPLTAFLDMLAGRPPRSDETPAVSAQNTRPAYDRDHEWLRWYEAEGSDTFHSHAAIRDKWNSLALAEREDICRTKPQTINPVAKGRRVIVMGIRRAAAERDAEA